MLFRSQAGSLGLEPGENGLVKMQLEFGIDPVKALLQHSSFSPFPPQQYTQTSRNLAKGFRAVGERKRQLRFAGQFTAYPGLRRAKTHRPLSGCKLT